MKDKESVHKKVQEHCDCFATTDYLAEMDKVKHDTDKEDAAVKFIALAALHGVNANAKKISILKDKTGNVSVMAKYRKTELPDPGNDVAQKLFQAVREITHIEQGEGKTGLALGIRDSSLDLEVKITEKEGDEMVTIKFPKVK